MNKQSFFEFCTLAIVGTTIALPLVGVPGLLGTALGLYLLARVYGLIKPSRSHHGCSKPGPHKRRQP